VGLGDACDERELPPVTLLGLLEAVGEHHLADNGHGLGGGNGIMRGQRPELTILK